MLFVLRKDGRIVFFTHASRPTPQAGDTIISYGPSRHEEPEAARGAVRNRNEQRR
jgi:hypothetical protein